MSITRSAGSRATNRDYEVCCVARQAFFENGFGRTSITEIAVAAKTSNSALLRKFGSKVGLLEEVYRHCWDDVAADVKASPSTDAQDPLKELKAIAQGIVVSCTSTALPTYCLAFCSEAQFDLLVEKRTDRMQSESRSHLIERVADCCNELERQNRCAGNMDADTIFALYFGLLKDFIARKYYAEKEGSIFSNECLVFAMLDLTLV